MSELPVPSTEDELRRAAERLAQAAGRRADRPSYDARINDSLESMRSGDVLSGYRALAELAAQGEGAAWHFLAWIHRYRAEIALREALECHQNAVSHGYAPSQSHMERVVSALEIVAYPTQEQLARVAKPPEDVGDSPS